ncbi:DMT family transporter [Candidatus Desantisbacteria bacterium]|nr:DMT family transporter [Candidatus Desantisbacteria bacterium]
MIKLHFIYGILGGLAALLSAAAWAFGSILFQKLGDEVSPTGMNLGKGIIGILYLGIALLLIEVEPVDYHTFIFIGISGLLGIALGDTFFFKALMDLGAKTTLLLGTLGPVFTVVLSVIFLHEKPSISGWLGISLTVGGVTWVMSKNSPVERMKKNWTSGIKYSLLSSLCISIGIIFAKAGISSISAMQAALIRFLFSVIGLAIYGMANHQLS